MLKMVGWLFSLLGLSNGGFQLWTEKDIKTYTIPLLATSIVTGLIILNLQCRTKSVISSTWWPERLKVRRSDTQPAPWRLWTS